MTEAEKIARMKELTALLQSASRAYYAQDREIMSNFEYDRLYDELVRLEKETGVTLSGSPTVSVGYEAVEELPKERHESPMLSLDKTKDREALRDWLNGKSGLLSWKLDGLTVVLTYENGTLQKAVTRGNGEVGEVITPNAKVFTNVPMSIPFPGKLILRGEAVISYPDFEIINAGIPDEGAKYKNPRNLCSGSVRQLDSSVTASRKVRFIAFSLVSAEMGEPAVEAENAAPDERFPDLEKMLGSAEGRMSFLDSLGFETVQRIPVTPDTILEAVEEFARRIRTYEIPSDGLVLTYEDVAYGQSLGRTAKFPRHSIAFKWADELAQTTLREMEWSASRTGLINPVAIFDPVELEGTTVSRASVHNVSIVRQLKLGIGDRITVYKANMIIPQIAENLTGSDSLRIPDRCPVCGGETVIRGTGEAENDSLSLYCTNPRCAAKQIGSFTQFVSRDAMNVDGLSEMTLEKFIDCGFIREYADLYRLDRYKDHIVRIEGFGEKSYANLKESIDRSRHTTLPRLLYGLGITGIGAANAKLLCRAFGDDLDAIRSAEAEDLSAVDKIGPVIAGAVCAYFRDAENAGHLDELLKELTLEKTAAPAGEQTLTGMSFVVTGSLKGFASREELKKVIEDRGGKVTGSVTGKTVCLINNDAASNSTKNRTAKELGVPILTEEEFVAKYLG